MAILNWRDMPNLTPEEKQMFCDHKNHDWPYCEQCKDEVWCCYECGKSSCDHNRSEDISPMNPNLMNMINGTPHT